MESQMKNVPSEFLKFDPLSGLDRWRFFGAPGFLILFFELFLEADSEFFGISDNTISYFVT